MLTAEDLASLLDSWLLQLAAEGKSDKTLHAYREGVRQFIAHCAEEGVEPALDPPTVAGYVVAIRVAGRAPATARLRQIAVRLFSAWLADEGEIDRDLLLGVKPPKLDERIIDELDADQLRALIKACAGKTLACRRDEAVVRLMAETGARAGEVVNMNVVDVDLSRGVAVIRRGKGGKARTVPFGPQTGAAIDRYLRVRRRQPHRDSLLLWVGERGQGFGYDALWSTLRRRARVAGIDPFHPHMLRHTFAGRWLDSGGTEGGLMAVAGWSKREMIDRYTRQTSPKRAADEARRLGLGDL